MRYTSLEEDWHLSQDQQEALLAEVALVVDGSAADEVLVGVDIASISSSSSQSIFSFDLILVLSVSTVPTHPLFQFQNCKSNLPTDVLELSSVHGYL